MAKQAVQPRAKIAHKLAKYIKANAVHQTNPVSANKPSVSHLTFGGAPQRKHRNNAKTWYPADDEKTHFRRQRNQPKACKGGSITAGQVVILLAGNHRGRRVIVLKSLPSGNLLVTGPHAINGVPLKRVNPAYVIPTSTKVNIDGITANVDDSFFKRQNRYTKDQLKNASETTTNKVKAASEADSKWREEARKVQKTIDGKIIQNVKKVQNLKGYLGTRFTLYSNTRPHELKF